MNEQTRHLLLSEDSPAQKIIRARQLVADCLRYEDIITTLGAESDEAIAFRKIRFADTEFQELAKTVEQVSDPEKAAQFEDSDYFAAVDRVLKSDDESRKR